MHLNLQKIITYHSGFQVSKYDRVDFLFFSVAGKHQIVANEGQHSSAQEEHGCAGFEKMELAQGFKLN